MDAAQRRAALLDVVFSLQYHEMTVADQAKEIGDALLRQPLSPQALSILVKRLNDHLKLHF